MTINSINGMDTEHELILKSQGGMIQECESIQVDYRYPTLHLYGCTGGTFTEIGTGVDVIFMPGNQFGVRAHADGTVEAFKDGMLLKTWDASSWPFYANGGRIGWASYGVVSPALRNDFGGG